MNETQYSPGRFFFHLFFCIKLLLIIVSLSLQAEEADNKRILFLGNSLTAGYGLNPEFSFPALIQQKIDSLGWRYEAVNAGLSGETSSGGLRRIEWLLRQKVDVLILALGANDGLRGISPQLTAENLQAIIDAVKMKYPDVKLVVAGMEVPPNMGDTYAGQFRGIFRKIAEKNRAALVPFLLKGVGGVPGLNLADGIHPNEAGHHIVANTVWEVLEPLLIMDSPGDKL